MRKETVTLYDIETDEMIEKEITIMTSEEIVNFMLNEDPDEYDIEVFAPSTLAYDPRHIMRAKEWYIDGKTITLLEDW